jgi:SAM-dependent methyltransferase
MALAEHRRDWEELADLDPMWAVLSEPQHKFGRWDVDEFFSTGAEEIAHLRRRLSELGLPDTFDSALEFGCGLGRLSRAMTLCCREVVGVDISEGMVRRAMALTPACQFLHRPDGDLSIFPPDRFDLVYSRRVLQHQRSTELILRFVSEFVRILKPGGVLAFQVPCRIPYMHRIQARRKLYEALRKLGCSPRVLYELRLTPVRMQAAAIDRVTAVVMQAGGRVQATDLDYSCPAIDSRFYYATK